LGRFSNYGTFGFGTAIASVDGSEKAESSLQSLIKTGVLFGMVKAYEMIWALIAVVATAFFVTGSMTLFAGVVFGFIAAGMIFAGMMMILPATVAHRNHPESPKAEPAMNNHFVPAGAVHAR